MPIRFILTCFFMFYLLPAQGQPESGDTSIFIRSVELYQKHISPIVGGFCQMYPSCSTYSIDAFKQKGELTALFYTTDRIMRCGRDLRNYPSVYTTSGTRYFDQVDGFFTHKILSSGIPGPDTISGTRLDFVRLLINKGLYHEALLEINRIMYDSSEVDSIELYREYMVVLHGLKEYDLAMTEYQVKFPVEIKADQLIKFEIGKMLVDEEKYEEAVQYFTLDDNTCFDTLLYPKSSMFLGLVYAHQHDWNRSIEFYKSVPVCSDCYENALDNISTIESAIAERYKKPAVAGTLAVIPGLGYLYSGYPGTALTAFLSNSLLIYATYTSVKSENYGVAVLSGLLSCSFYLGNIIGSVRSADRYNYYKRQMYLDRLKVE